MKNSIFQKLALVAIALFIFSFGAFAQKVGNLVFLKGQYLEVGIAECGVFGNLDSTIIPAGYHPRSENEGLGFVADPDQDGFNVGTPDYCGDYFTPGTPEEGFGVEIGGTNFGNFMSDCDPFEGGQQDIPTDFSKISHTNTINNVSSTWEGNIVGLNIKKTTSFPKNGLYFVTQVTLTNNSGTILPDVYYMRNVDPDNEQPITGDYTTFNRIVHQPTAVDSTALVEAIGLVHGCYIGLGTLDNRARVTHGGFSNRDASDIYNGFGFFSAPGDTVTDDAAISLAFYFGSMAPGSSVSFAFAYVLDPAQLPVALGTTVIPPQFLVGGVNVTTADTAEICPGVPVDIEITNGNSYTWTWSPGTDLSDSTGTLVTATLTVPQRTYTITGISATDTVVKVLTLKAAGIPALSAPNLNADLSDPPFVLNNATPPGGTYSGPGVSAGNIFSPAAAGLGVHVIEYMYTVAAGCSDSIDFTITVTSGGPDSCDLVCPSDSTWSQSTVITPTNLSGMWTGVGGVLPGAGTFTDPVQVGQPFPWKHIDVFGSADPITSGSNITYYRKTFNLSTTNGLEARFRMNVDDQGEIYVNGNLIARIENLGNGNRANPNHDAFFFGAGSSTNGYLGGDSYAFVTATPMSSIFQTGSNDVVVVVRNLGKPSNIGGFAFQMDLGGCGAGLIPFIMPGESKRGVVQNLDLVNVYPNPNTGQFTVAVSKFDPEAPGSVYVYDVNGRLVHEVSLAKQSVNVDISSLATGIYQLKVESNEVNHSCKIIKQ